MTSYNYSSGNNITYNSEHYTIFRRRTVSGQAAYLIRKISDGTVVDNVLESECSSCSSEDVVNSLWGNFTYTGDNSAASNWILNNLIKNIQNASGIEYNSNSDNTVYTFSINNGSNSWTKNVS